MSRLNYSFLKVSSPISLSALYFSISNFHSPDFICLVIDPVMGNCGLLLTPWSPHPLMMWGRAQNTGVHVEKKKGESARVLGEIGRTHQMTPPGPEKI